MNSQTDLKTGDILLFSADGLYSNVVKSFTRSKWSHVAMIINNAQHDRLAIWESNSEKDAQDLLTGNYEEGVRLVCFNERINAFNGKVSVRRLEGALLNEQLIEALDHLMVRVMNKPYEKSKAQLLGAVPKSHLIGNKKEDLSSLFCSELIAEAYQELGLLPCDISSNTYTPSDFSTETGLELLGDFYLSEEKIIK